MSRGAAEGEGWAGGVGVEAGIGEQAVRNMTINSPKRTMV
jgi:hypothetical protein